MSGLILVTGGAGYIGSHTILALKQANYQVIALDNLTHGKKDVIESIPDTNLIIGDVGDRNLLKDVLSGAHLQCGGQMIAAVIHFAASAYVGESISNPSKYYENNLVNTEVLLNELILEGKRRGTGPIPIVFSSTCSVYGNIRPEQVPISEATIKIPINPYGRSKLMIEQILNDYWKAYNLPALILRYFNAAGADPECRIGENHLPHTRLIPEILDVASGKYSHVKLFGSDYDTADGTCIRDYIHVCDLADAHVLGLSKLLLNPSFYSFNLGSGTGYSVKQIINTVEKVTGKRIHTIGAPRREGDPAILIASPKLAKDALNWHPKLTNISLIIEHAWKWHRKNNPA